MANNLQFAKICHKPMSGHRNDPSGVWPNDYVPFTSTKDEIQKMMVGLGKFSIQANKIRIQDYPFEPSKVYGSMELFPHDISNIDISSLPLIIRTGDELVFVPATETESFRGSY